MKCSPHKVGLVVGLTLGGWHLVWSLLVLLGWGQAVWDFILDLHMIHMSIVVGPFDLAMALSLVALTGVIGYVAGYVAGVVWNWAHK